MYSIIERAKKKTAAYSPQFAYVVANKRVNSKFYNDLNYQNVGKFQPNVANPDPGCVVFDDLSTDDAYDFHLVAQKVTQGSCTPTHYRIAYDASLIPQ